MPNYCCAVGCKNHGMMARKLSFFAFPSEPERREKWIASVKRMNSDGSKWEPGKYAVLCSDHFIQGYDPPPASEPQPPPQAYPPSQGDHSNQQYETPGSMENNVTMETAQPTTTGTLVVQARPPDYLVPSCLACLFCCWPTGITAVHYACEANRLADMGDVVNATNMSTRARNMMLLTVLLGVVWITLVILTYAWR